MGGVEGESGDSPRDADAAAESRGEGIVHMTRRRGPGPFDER